MTNWTKEELQAYMLIWAANADFIEQEDEVDFMVSKMNKDIYKKMHKEFIQDNDQQGLNKIEATLERLNYTDSEKDQILVDIKEMFLADGKMDILEQNLSLGLKRILK